MRATVGRIAFVVGLLSGTAMPVAAGAQTPLPSEQQSDPEPSGAGNDIVVTARRFEERLSDVPISISVFNQTQINKLNVSDLSDLAKTTPSLFANTRSGSASTTFNLRGFNQEPLTAPTVAVYFADVVALRGGAISATGEGAGPGSLFDLQNVQVVKGPQGTLFGRNTTGGAILLVPQKPTDRFEGYVEGSVGNYDMRRIQAAVNIPLGDQARLRIGGDRMVRDGYQKNIGLGPRRLTDIDYIALRASLVVDLTPDLENYTIVSYNNSSNDGHTNTVTECNPTRVVGGVPQGAFTCAQIAREAASGNGFYTVSHYIPDSYQKIESWQIINTTTLTASDALTIKNIISYGELKNNTAQDFFGVFWLIPSIAEQQAIRAANPGVTVTITDPRFVGLPLTFTAPVDPPGLNYGHQSTLVEEFQLQGRLFEGRMQWQAGVYYEKTSPLDSLSGNVSGNLLNCGVYDPTSGTCQAPYGTVGRIGSNLSRFSNEDIGVYAQTTYSITDALRLTAGIRYTHDRSRSTSQLRNFRFSTANALVATQCQIVTAVAPACITQARQTTDAPTWVLGLDYKPIEDILLYAKYSRGYRQGQAYPQGLPPGDMFDAEKLDAYEGGLKASWRGSVPGSFNLAGFYNKLHNQQLGVGLVNPPVTSNIICSCFTSRIYGFEAEGQVSPFEGFDLSGAYTYLNTKILEFAPPGLPPGFTFSNAVPVGGPLILVPKHKWSATATYTLPFVPETAGALSLGLTYSYTGDYNSGFTTRTRIEHYHLLNANVNWRDVGGLPVDLALFATNLTKEKYYTFVSDVYASLGFVSKVTGEPRVYGLRLKYRFGS